MRNLIFLLLSLPIFGQNIEVYEYTNGIRNITAKEIIEEGVSYDVIDGVKQITPKYEFQSNQTQLYKKLENDPVYNTIIINAPTIINYYKIYTLTH